MYKYVETKHTPQQWVNEEVTGEARAYPDKWR